MYYRVMLVLIFLFCILILASCEEDWKKEAEAHKLPRWSIGPDGHLVDSSNFHSLDTAAAKTEAPKHHHTEEPFVFSLWDEIISHWHNKIAHFTVALPLTAFLLTLLSFKWKKVEPSILVLVGLAALSSLFSYITGFNAEDEFEGTAKEWVVNIHMILGSISLGSIWIWLIFLLLPQLRHYAWIVGLIVAVLISITGFWGGVVAYG